MTTVKVLKIVWNDSTASNYRWSLIDELDGDYQPIKIITYGALIEENKDFVCVAQNYGLSPLQCCSLMTIPKGCILEKTVIDKIEIKPKL